MTQANSSRRLFGRGIIGSVVLSLFFGCAHPQPANMTAIIARQSQYEEVKKLAKWKSIYYRPAVKRMGCNLGDQVPGISGQLTVYFDDALPWPIRTITPHLRGCAWRQVSDGKIIGGKAYYGLTGSETIDSYGLQHEVDHMTGNDHWWKEVLDWAMFSFI